MEKDSVSIDKATLYMVAYWEVKGLASETNWEAA